MKHTLLVGNGPNYFSRGVSWADVVRAAAKHTRLSNQTEKIMKEPLPLVYETIAAHGMSSESKIKGDLAKAMRAMTPNPIHEQLMSLGWDTVLTTNYDHCLEEATGKRFIAANLDSETTYSVFRRRQSGTRFVWHIHGDLSGPRTMMLGMHQYCGYVQKLRKYLTTRSESPFVFGDPMDIERGRHSWADLFLRDHVHIVGLGLGYEELLLWWLLGYKYRLKHKKRLPCGGTTYYFAGTISPSMKGRVELLMAYGVKVVPIPSASGLPTVDTWSKLVRILQSI